MFYTGPINYELRKNTIQQKNKLTIYIYRRQLSMIIGFDVIQDCLCNVALNTLFVFGGRRRHYGQYCL